MSANWTDPSGDSYEKYTGEPRHGGTPSDGPQDSYRGPGSTGYPPPAQGYPPPAQGYPGPGDPAYPGQPSPSYGPQSSGPGMPSPYAQSVPVKNGSAITLLIVSIVLTFFGCGLGIPSLVMSIIALNKGSRDSASARSTVRAGWITFSVLALLTALFWILALVGGFMSDRG
jgi:hypothetical protein